MESFSKSPDQRRASACPPVAFAARGADGIVAAMPEPVKPPENPPAPPVGPKRKLPLAEPSPLGEDDDEPVPPGNYPPLVEYDD